MIEYLYRGIRAEGERNAFALHSAVGIGMALAVQRPVQEVTAIKLDARFLGQQFQHPAAYRLGLAGIALGLLFDHALHQAGGKGDARRLDDLQVAGRQETRAVNVAVWLPAVLEQAVGAANVAARRGPHQRGRVGRLEQAAHGGHGLRQVKDAILAQGHNAWAGGLARALASNPGAANQRPGHLVFRQPVH